MTDFDRILVAVALLILALAFGYLHYRIRHVQAQLQLDVDDANEQIAGLVDKTGVERLSSGNKTLYQQIQLHNDAALGFWRTAKGEVLRIRDMSTGHLRNCINGGFAKDLTAHKMSQEIARRTEDQRCRALDTEDPTIAEMSYADQVVMLDRLEEEAKREHVFLVEDRIGYVFMVYKTEHQAAEAARKSASWSYRKVPVHKEEA